MNYVKLGEIFEISSSKRVFQSEWKDSGIPFYRGREIVKLATDGFVENDLFIDEEMYEKYKQYGYPQPGDILITAVGTLGVCYVVKEGDKFYYKDGNIISLKLKSNDVNPFYVKYAFSTNMIKEQINKGNSGTTVGTLTISNAKKLILPLPSIEIQNKIVKSLEQVQSVLEKRKQQIFALDELTQSLFIEMFGDLKTSTYPITTLGEICKSIKDGPHKSPNYTKNGVPFISVNNIIKGKWNLENVKYISQEDFEIFAKRCKPELGDVLYTKGGTTGFAKYVDLDIDFINWVHIAVLKFDRTNVDGIFLAAMLNMPFCYVQSQLYTRGIANRDLVLGQMKKIQVLLPPITLQQNFSGKFKMIKKQKDLLEEGFIQLNVFYDALLQKAFKGELFQEQ